MSAIAPNLLSPTDDAPVIDESNQPAPTPPALAGDGHRVQLDAVRAIAVVLVMVHHYVPAVSRRVEVGNMAVRVFFVLSGFLITGILLRARDKAERIGESRWCVLRAFYARRLLRIFPVYYLVLIGMAGLGARQVRDGFWWHAGYLSNVYMYRLGTGHGSVTHFWSLAVEEQFYLVWPLLMLFTPRRLVTPLIVAAIAAGPIFRAAVLLHGGNAWQASILTPACLDTLGMGALLAVLSAPAHAALKHRVLTAALIAGLPLYLATAINYFTRPYPSHWWAIPFSFGIALWAAWLIDRTYRGFHGLVGRALSLRPLTYLGAISYGVYVMHNFVDGFVTRGFKAAHLREPAGAALVMYTFAATFVAATVSWHLFEKPINRLKSLFPYTA